MHTLKISDNADDVIGPSVRLLDRLQIVQAELHVVFLAEWGLERHDAANTIRVVVGSAHDDCE